MSALTDAATVLVNEVAEAIADLHELVTTNADLAAKLAEAIAKPNNDAEVAAVSAQLVQSAADLKTALDAVHPAQPAA